MTDPVVAPGAAAPEQRSGQIVFTNKARCRDCYRCVRVCPVKAISVKEGQASVDETRCICCGTCIRECPQKAKSYRRDRHIAQRLLESDAEVVASVAPSFAAFFDEWQRKRFPSALRRLGFSFVAETSVGAYYVAVETAKIAESRKAEYQSAEHIDSDSPHAASNPAGSHHTMLSTACPAVVNYIERYRPEYLDTLIPVASPMIAHGRMIRKRLGSPVKVVFIGPCVAKKQEAEREEHRGVIDCVLTFEEIAEWLDEKEIRFESLEESDFDEVPRGYARYFPLAGGGLKTGGEETDLLSHATLAVSGYQEIHDLLESCRDSLEPRLVEPLFCSQGCINGPAAPGETTVLKRRANLLEYIEASSAGNPETAVIDNSGRAASERGGVEAGTVSSDKARYPGCSLSTVFSKRPVPEQLEITEEAVNAVYAKTGKTDPEHRLNCGACGYSSCREQAEAVIRGMAEPDMCIPYMRRMAERRTDKIIETSPNGIVVVDERLRILSMNPAFRKLFICTDGVLGKHISYLMDPDPFEQIATSAKDVIERTGHHDNYNLIAHEIFYPLPYERQIVGIFTNITSNRSDRKQLDDLRYQTVLQAQELQHHQIELAKNVAGMLGEFTSQGEQLVERLLAIADDANGNDQKREVIPWGTSTSK